MWHYRWSSYNEYIRRANIIDVDFILNLYSNNRQEAIREFIEFNNKSDKKTDGKQYKEYEICDCISDNEAIEIIKSIFNIDNILEIKKYNVKIRNNYIKEILDIKGITGRQIARILHVDKKIVYSIAKGRCVPNGDKSPHRETSPMDPKEVQNG